MPALGFLAPPARLLVALTQRAEVREPVGDAIAVLTSSPTRERFLQLGRELGVEGLALSELLVSDVAEIVPSQTFARLKERLAQLRRQAMVWDLERERVLHALNRSGISATLLKGSALRELIFHEPAHRSMGDLDLLVGTAELDTALRALREAGYSADPPEAMRAQRRHHFHYLLTHPRGFIVELHWALSEPGAQTTLDAKAFMRRAESIGRAGSAAFRVPSPEDLLVHVVSQNADDAFGLLRRVVDVDRIIARWPELDWEYVVRAAQLARLDIVLAASLRIAERIMHSDVPPSVLERLQVPAASRFHLALLQPVAWVVSLPSARRDTAFEAMRLWCTLGGKDRLRALAGIARGADPLTDAIQTVEPDGRPGPLPAGAGALRLAKLALFHLVAYARGSFTAVTARGRQRLRFWR